MANKPIHETDDARTPVYQIRLKGHLGPDWAGWFGDMAITLEDNGETLLTGQVIDQPALFGLLKKVRDSGLSLLSVTRIEAEPANGTRKGL